MPRSLTYKAKSVIYFKGDRSSLLYVVKSGTVLITTDDDLSNIDEKSQRVLSVGEFFGIRAAVSGHPYDESAVAVDSVELVALSHSEFEGVVINNSGIVLKLLRIYSKQLTDMHLQIAKQMVVKEEQTVIDPESGLYNVGVYFLQNRLYEQAIDAFNRYKNNFPKGQFVQEADTKIAYAQPKIGSNEDNTLRFYPNITTTSPTTPVAKNDAVMAFNAAKTLFNSKKYAPSLIKFGIILRSSDEELDQYKEESLFLSAEALFYLQKYTDSLEQLNLFFIKYPSSVHKVDALHTIARNYEALDNPILALVYYCKLFKVLPETSPFYSRIKAIVKQ